MFILKLLDYMFYASFCC